MYLLRGASVHWGPGQGPDLTHSPMSVYLFLYSRHLQTSPVVSLSNGHSFPQRSQFDPFLIPHNTANFWRTAGSLPSPLETQNLTQRPGRGAERD